MADSIFHNFVDDTRIFGGFVCVYSINKKISKPANEYVGK